MKMLPLRTIYKICFLIFVAFVACNFQRFIAFLIQDVGTYIRDVNSAFGLLGSYYPYYLWNAINVYLIYVLYLILFPHSYEGKKKTYLYNGLILAGLGFLLTLLIVIKWISGDYPRAIMRSATFLYPFDCALWGVIIAAFGALLFFYGKKYYQEEPAENFFPKAPYPFLLRGFFHFFRGFYLLVALFFFGDVFFYFLSLDWSCSHVSGEIVLLLLISLPVLGVGAYFFGFKDQKDPLIAKKVQFFASIGLLGLSIVSLVWLLINEAVDPNFLTEISTPLFPFDHMKMSAPPLGPILCLAWGFVGSLAGLCHWLIDRFLLKKVPAEAPKEEPKEEKEEVPAE